MRTILFIALTLATAPTFAAQPLLPERGNDQVPSRLAAVPAPTAAIERAPVSFSWKLDPNQALSAPQPHVAQSREYWQTVSGAELAAGVPLQMSAAGSLIRVSPSEGARALRGSELQIQGVHGRAAHVQSMASAEQLQAAGMSVNNGTVIAKLGREDGAGGYTLRVAQAEGDYVVHVFEPESDQVLRASASADRALAGGQIRLNAAFEQAGRTATAEADALLVAPDGRNWPVRLNAVADGALSADVKLPADVGNAQGLWELQVFANAGGVQRDARTAFAVAAPTARFFGNTAFNARNLRMALPVQAGSEGRYEARGTLYATAPDGSMRPVSQAHSAAWMKRGLGVLTLQFDRTHLPQGYRAPFEVRHLELNDQSRMAPLERRERAAKF